MHPLCFLWRKALFSGGLPLCADGQYSDVEEQFSESEDGFLDGPLPSYEVAQHESTTSRQSVEEENGGASTGGADEITLKPVGKHTVVASTCLMFLARLEAWHACTDLSGWFRNPGLKSSCAVIRLC